MIRPRSLAWLLSAPLLSGCGGKLAPLGDAGLDAGEDAESFPDASHEAAAFPEVDSVTPSSGPNSGGTTVTITGAGFATDGGTQFTFQGFPAPDVACASDTQCTAVTPFPGFSQAAQVVEVQATVGGVLGQSGSRTSTTSPRDHFTYTGGPACTSTLTCPRNLFPQLNLVCPSVASFYEAPLTTNQQLAGTGTTYSTTTNSIPGDVVACDGTPTDGSCTSYSQYVALSTYCGDPNFCYICEHFLFGHCYTSPTGNPTCLGATGFTPPTARR
jgi:hypothetical protein